ncbi:MAG: FkbM family methyltransferase [Almyronema sp.]
MIFFKRLAKATVNKLGYEISRKRAGIPGVSFASEPFEAQRQILSSLNKTDISIFDIGAHKGRTVETYRAKFPTSEIYCFEPFPDSVVELQKQFSADSKIHVVSKAVAQAKGTTTFYVNGFDATHSLLPRPQSERRYYPKLAKTKHTIKVETIDLDSFVQENNIGTIDILKFDIQGGELKALQGATSILNTGNVSLIYIEIMFIAHYENSPLFHEIWSFLSKFGYSVFDVYDLYRAKNGQIRYGDALFVNQNIRNNIINQCDEEP